MTALETRIRMAAESILDNEALRSGLNDEGAARALLDWGVSWAKHLAAQTATIEDDEEADEAIYPRMKALRGIMTTLKDLALSEGWSPETIRQAQETILEQARILYGAGWQPPASLEGNATELLHNSDSRQRLEVLLGWLTAPAPTATEALSQAAPATTSPPQPEGFFAKLWKRLRGA